MKFGGPQLNKDGSYRMRDVTKPVYLLKTLQKEINDYLREFELPDCMYGGVLGRNNVLNALQHRGNKFFFTIDLKIFFGNISNLRVNHILIDRGFTWDEARMIARITTFKESLPQGAPTSTTLANLAFAHTASLIEDFCSKKGIKFTVFVDDLTFSSRQCFKHYKDQILEIIKQNKFFVNQRKVHYRHNCCEITGLYVKGNKLFLPKQILANINKPGISEYIESFRKQYKGYLM